MNKIDPLFEAMSNIEDSIVSDVIKEKSRHPRCIRAISIAAAAAVICAVTAVTAVAVMKAPREVIMNDVPIEPYYTTYIDELGDEISLYVYDIPDYALGKEAEGHTAVGNVKVVPNPEYPGKWGKYMIVDEAGNVFHTGINNKLVEYRVNGQGADCGYACTNLRDGYSILEFFGEREEEWNNNNCSWSYNKLEIYVVPTERADDFFCQRVNATLVQ